MEITNEKVKKSKEVFNEYGNDILKLLGIPANSVIYSSVKKGFFGSKGDIFTDNEHIFFKSNKNFSKLKSKLVTPFSDYKEVKFEDGSYYLDWLFKGGKNELSIWFEYYDSQEGFSQSDLFWYNREEFEDLSSGFFKLIEAIYSKTGMKTGKELLMEVEKNIEDAVSQLISAKKLAKDGALESLSGKDPYAVWNELLNSFALFLLAASTADEEDKNDFLNFFQTLDEYYGKILNRFRAELVNQSNRLLKEDAIYSIDEQFQKLSAMWYLRQIAVINYGEKITDKENIKSWDHKVVRTRSSSVGEKLKIKIPDDEIFITEIERITGKKPE